MEQQHIAPATRRTVLAGIAATLAPGAQAQQSNGMRRVGVLMPGISNDPLIGQVYSAALIQGLAALNWREGYNLRLDWRWPGGDRALVERYAAELVALGPNVLLAVGNAAVEALRRQTSTIPIVFGNVNDPIDQGFVGSLSHPGGNLTGFSNYEPPMAGKWLGMLTQITPPVARVAVLFNPTLTPYDVTLRAIDEAARPLALAVQAAPVRDDAEIEAMMAGLARAERGGGILVLPGTFSFVHRDAIVALAARYRLPAVYPFRVYAAAGGLMSYGTDLIDPYRRAAAYVDRILKGAKPADLPVQAPTKFELVINLKTAKALGVTIPPTLLARADEVIEE